MSDRAFGLYFLLLGIVGMLPSTGRAMRRHRDWQFRVMPWLRRFPGANFLYSDSAERVLRTSVSVVFIVVGFLAAIGLIDFDPPD